MHFKCFAHKHTGNHGLVNPKQPECQKRAKQTVLPDLLWSSKSSKQTQPSLTPSPQRLGTNYQPAL